MDENKENSNINFDEFDQGHEESSQFNKKSVTSSLSGSSFMKYLIGILILGGAIWYFVSDPFAAKVDMAYEENSTWNAKTITDDPEAYIYSAIQHIDNLEDNLKNEEFRIKTRINQLTRESDSSQTAIESLSSDIQRWKNDYLILDGRKDGELLTSGYSKETLKDLIIQADARIQGEEQKSTFYPNALINLEGMLARIESGLKDLERQKIEMDIARTNLRVNVGDDSINNIRDTINSITDTTTALVSDITKVSIENASARDAKFSVDRKFEDILDD